MHPDDTPVEINGQIMTMSQARELERQQLAKIAGDMVKMRDEWVAHRSSSGVEARWTKNRKLYLGEETGPDDSMMSVARNGPRARGSQPPRSRIVVNIVRPKVDQAIARMCEILLPTDEQNWEIRPTPVPETVQKRLGDTRQTVDPQTGQPTGVTADDEAQAIVEAARERAQKMSERIADHLTECDYNTQSRMGIEDGVVLGTMVLKGPRPGKEIAKIWQPGPDGSMSMTISEKTVPGTERIDPWDVWFDPACGNDHQRGRGVWHLRRVTRKELRQLVGLPGYDAEAIREVLMSRPQKVSVIQGRVSRTTPAEDVYELWEYHGEIEPEDFESLSSRAGDPISDVDFGVVLFVNDTPISAIPSWVADGSLPYHVWNWRRADDSPYGYGMPDEQEHQQRAVNSAWRMVMDNGRMALAPQVVIKRKLIEPMDGDPTIGGGIKLWSASADLEDVRQAFTVFDFPSHVQELMLIADKAMQFSDFETSMPQLMNGNQGTGPAPETVGGMTMLYNNANTVLRLRVKQYDDRITRPHIGQYYDYLMANDPDPSIKGDFEIDARGSAALIERDIQNQATLNLAAITSNPRYAPHMKEREEIKAILKAFKFQPDALMRSEDEVKASQENVQAPPDPRIVAAQMTLEGKKLDIQDRKEQRQADMQMHQGELSVKGQTLAYNAERERAQGEQERRQADQEAELAIVRMQQDGLENAEERASRERLQAMQISSKNALFNAEAALRVRTGEGI